MSVEEVVDRMDRDLFAVEGDASDASADAERALRIVTDEAAEEERDFVRRTERPRGGE